MLRALVLAEAPDHRAPARHLEVHQVASAARPSVEHHLLARVVQVLEVLQVLAQQQGAPLATVLAESDQVDQTQGTREDLEIPVTREILGLRARVVAQLAGQAPRDAARGVDAPKSAILILAPQQVEPPQLSARRVARAVERHALVLHAQPPGAHRAQPEGRVRVQALQGVTSGQWVTRATRAVGRRGQVPQQRAGEALAVILAANHAVILVEVLGVILVPTRAAITAGLAEENPLVQAERRGLSLAQGAALAPSLCQHLRPNADQLDPLRRACRSPKFSAMCLGESRVTLKSEPHARVRDE